MQADFTGHWKELAALILALLAACTPVDPPPLQGYVEGEFVRLASPFAGTLVSLAVARGQRVQAGAPLFVLEQDNETAARLEAERRLEAARARRDNLRKGRRPAEIAAIEAQLDQARAQLAQSQAQFEREQKLARRGFIAADRLDASRSVRDRDRARVRELTQQLAVARLPARPDEIRAAEAEVEAAAAALRQATWRLEQKSLRAPADALVEDTYYNEGEWVPAGAPVVSLLPPGNVKIRFYVPEPELARLKLGQAVRIFCDGCAPVRARVSYIAPRAEYTPPVIYSKNTRAQLVFLVEARPAQEDALRFHPGQPVDVRLTE